MHSDMSALTLTACITMLVKQHHQERQQVQEQVRQQVVEGVAGSVACAAGILSHAVLHGGSYWMAVQRSSIWCNRYGAYSALTETVMTTQTRFCKLQLPHAFDLSVFTGLASISPANLWHPACHTDKACCLVKLCIVRYQACSFLCLF